MFGGTPSNISLPYYKKGFVEIISGVNLPMLLKASTIENDDNFEEAVKIIVNSCKENIIVAGDLGYIMSALNFDEILAEWSKVYLVGDYSDWKIQIDEDINKDFAACTFFR